MTKEQRKLVVSQALRDLREHVTVLLRVEAGYLESDGDAAAARDLHDASDRLLLALRSLERAEEALS
jgi:hypothetical protein